MTENSPTDEVGPEEIRLAIDESANRAALLVDRELKASNVGIALMKLIERPIVIKKSMSAKALHNLLAQVGWIYVSAVIEARDQRVAELEAAKK
jgi:hypothetical protein